MMNISLQKRNEYVLTPGGHIFFLYKDQPVDTISESVRSLCPQLGAFLASRKCKGTEGELVSIPLADNIGSYLIYVGLGSKNGIKGLCIESYRRAIARAIRCAVGLYVPSVTIQLPEAEDFGVAHEYLVEQTAIFACMSEYHFDQYITDADRKEHRIANCYLVTTQTTDLGNSQKSLKAGVLTAGAVNKARHWIDTPPLHATPLFLSDEAKKIGASNGLTVTVFSEKEIIAMGMGGLEAVSRGSDVDCQLVVMEYKSTELNAPTIAIVGKGITFDSGGLSLKPAASMETMKDDMAGAAAVITTMEVIAQLKPKVNVIAIAPLSENLPSGKATKPGDVIKFYNGKTAEIKNTDAEGRLILADALSYAVKHYKPDAIIDIATLTGACAYALGPYFTGLMSQHDDLVAKIEAAAKKSGDYVWRLPMTNDYKKAIKSDVADICNIGDGRIKAGAITAAHFLQHFVGDVPWAHLDIAGTAFDVPNIPYFRSGATGAGVRLLITVIMNW